VGTDGHRLALERLPFNGAKETIQFILPRKAVMELLRTLKKEGNSALTLQFSPNAICFNTPEFRFISRLIDGRFPDYRRAIPKAGHKVALVERELLKQVLQRVAILTNEKYRAARLFFKPGLLAISANNTEQEEVEDELEIEYQEEATEIAFNVSYLIDVLNVLKEKHIKMIFSNAENSVLIESETPSEAAYVIMPMSL
jgi:DNA polymerase-3 subunit beta